MMQPRATLPLLPVVAETVLPGEERAIDPGALHPTAVRYLEQAPSGIELALLPVTALAEVPLLAPGRYATRATWLGRQDGSLRFSGQARVRIVAAKGTSAPFEADVQTSEMTHGDTDELRRLVLLAAAAIAHGPPPIEQRHHAHVAAVAASLLRALDGGPGVRSALADGDLHSALEAKTRSFVAESPGREALVRIEKEVRALAEQPSLGKPLRQRLHSAIVEIARRLDIYDPNAYKDDGLDELDLLRRRLDQAGLPTATRVVVERELRLLRQMKPDHHDYTTHLRLLQLIGRLAWHAAPLPPVDLGRVRAVLDRDHTGLEKPKRRILEHLAVRALGGEGRSMVLCIAGPPGVGKTSIARAIAEALDRPFVRIALGGVHDEAELRGHRITYTGARPGRIIDGLAQAGSRSALVLLDELDKVGADRQRSPVGALLEILDPEQNHAFSDNFLSVPYDLSDCLFLTTANELSDIPPYLLDRLEVIELDGYTTKEKVAIARAHLGASLAKEHGIEPLDVSDETMAMGMLPEDPLAGMDASAAQAITEPLATLATVLDDASGHTRETRSETITQALERLPDRIVVALFPRLVHGEWDHRLLGSLVMETLGREGGAEVVYRAFTGNDTDEDRAYFALYERVDEVAALPAPRKAEIAAVMGKLPDDDRTPVESVLFDMAIRCATPDELFPLVEAAVASQWIFTSSILRDPPVPGTRLADTLAQALRDGFPEPWAHDAQTFRGWLSKGPRPWVRELAEIAIRSDHTESRRWALDLLTDSVWDEQRDGPLRERALALATDPRYAADFLDVWALTMRVLGFFRSRLRSGGATIEQAIATMVAIRTFGKEDMARYARWVDASDLVAATEQEWLELRKARKAACASNPEEARSHSYYLQAREPGNPEDDALLASWIADLKDGKEAGRAMAVMLRSTEGTQEMEMIRGVFERFGDNDQVKAVWEYYEFAAEKAGSRSRG